MAYVDVPTDMKNGEVQYLADYLFHLRFSENMLIVVSGK